MSTPHLISPSLPNSLSSTSQHILGQHHTTQHNHSIHHCHTFHHITLAFVLGIHKPSTCLGNRWLPPGKPQHWLATRFGYAVNNDDIFGAGSPVPSPEDFQVNWPRYDFNPRKDLPRQNNSPEHVNSPEQTTSPQRTNSAEHVMSPEHVNSPENTNLAEQTTSSQQTNSPEHVNSYQKPLLPQQTNTPEHPDPNFSPASRAYFGIPLSNASNEANSPDQANLKSTSSSQSSPISLKYLRPPTRSPL